MCGRAEWRFDRWSNDDVRMLATFSASVVYLCEAPLSTDGVAP